MPHFERFLARKSVAFLQKFNPKTVRGRLHNKAFFHLKNWLLN